MQSYYSVYGTRIHLLVDDDFAANYNRAQDAFAEAQREFKKLHGTNWSGEPFMIEWTPEERDAFNKFADLMNSMIEMSGGSLAIKQEDMTSMHLIKL